ncbi:hypothetical protein QUF81_19520 [Peribacillus simplex]|nr:hypothetical protein [Peribacillus simplex]MDV7767253.1 hypothetical protein [Peribacillus sp. CSMR9]
MISMFNHPNTTLAMGIAGLKKVVKEIQQEIYADSWDVLSGQHLKIVN